MKILVALTSVIALTALHSQAFSTGAPVDACETLTPRHLGMETRDRGSYLFIETFPLSPGKWLVKLRSLFDIEIMKGFIMQARETNNTSNYQTFGSFESFTNTSRTTTCLSENDTVTHTRAENEERRLYEVYWQQPETGSGSVTFV